MTLTANQQTHTHANVGGKLFHPHGSARLDRVHGKVVKKNLTFAKSRSDRDGHLNPERYQATTTTV